MKKLLYSVLTLTLLSCGDDGIKPTDKKDGEDDNKSGLVDAFEINGNHSAIVSAGYSVFSRNGTEYISFCLTSSPDADIKAYYDVEKKHLPEYVYLTVGQTHLGQKIDLAKTTTYWSCGYVRLNTAAEEVEKELVAGSTENIPAAGSLTITRGVGDSFEIALDITFADGSSLKAGYEGDMGFFETKETVSTDPANGYKINGRPTKIRSALCIVQITGDQTYYTFLFSPEEVYNPDGESMRIELSGSDFDKRIPLADGSVCGWKVEYTKSSAGSGETGSYYCYDSDFAYYADEGYLSVSKIAGNDNVFLIDLVVSDGDYLEMGLRYSGRIDTIIP